MLTAMAGNRDARDWDARFAGIDTPGFLPTEASPEAHEAQRRSEHSRLRRRFLEVARYMAEEEGITDPYAPRSLDLIGEALDVAESILFAFPSLGSDSDSKAKMSAYEVREKLRLTYPAMDGSEMVEMVRDGRKFRIDFARFESGVKRYLESRFRDLEIDRTILMILIDAKSTSFVKAMTERPTIGGKHVWFNYSLETTAKRTALGLWLEGRFVDIVIAATLAIPALFFADLLGLPTSAIDAIIYLALGFVCVQGLWYLVSFPRAIRELAELRGRVIGGIEQMISFYSTYHSIEGDHIASPHAISVPRLRADIERLAEKDNIWPQSWPQSLWAMLDDIEGRGLRRL